MAFIELKCKECGYEYEGLVNGGNYPLCPKCGGQILQKKSKRGYKYFGCETAPKCDFMTWNEPTDQLCPQCGKTLFKKRGMLLCETEGCGYEQKVARKSRKTAGDNE